MMKINRKHIDSAIAKDILNYEIKGYNGYGNPFVDIWENGLYYPFSPSTKIDDAFRVVKKLKQKDNYIFKLEDGETLDYKCIFSDTVNTYYGEGETPEMAICLAAIKINGVALYK